MKTFVSFGVLIFCCMFPAYNAFAAATCTATTTSINFGNYDVFSSADDNSTGDITITCDKGGPAGAIAINQGINGTFNPRMMKISSGTDTLNYNIFTTAAYSTIWGDGTSGTQTVSFAPKKGSQTFTIYGKIPKGQDVSVGSYSDTLTVTVSW